MIDICIKRLQTILSMKKFRSLKRDDILKIQAHVNRYTIPLRTYFEFAGFSCGVFNRLYGKKPVRLTIISRNLEHLH